MNKLKLKFQIRTIIWKLTLAFSYFIKRMLDVMFSLLVFMAASPLLIATALAIWIENPGPILFHQIRVGKNGREFKFWKFRSMRTNAEALKKEMTLQNESKDGVIFKIKNDPRITKVGKIIRKFSIDELPQLYNVFIGDMSLVGPRPPIPSEVAQYTLNDRKRLHVTPGITCIWQVSGRSDIPFKQQVELDKQYIQSQNIWTDFMILLKTVPAVITGKGAY